MKYLNNIFGALLIAATSVMTAGAQQPGPAQTSGSARTSSSALTPGVRQGTIIYDRTVDMYRHLPDQQMRAMMPQFQTAEYELIFKDSIVVYKGVPKDEAPDPFEPSGGGGQVILKIGGPGDVGVLYTNLSSGRLLEEMSLDDKKYIVTDSIKPMAWRLTGDTATILGHVCKRAVATGGHGRPVVGWYTEEIPLAVGPDKFGGLPGAVLKVDVDGGWMVFTATKISPSVETGGLRRPSNGKTLTRSEFQKKMDQLMGPADSTGRRMMMKKN
jgi:GLPGLI family protein